MLKHICRSLGSGLIFSVGAENWLSPPVKNKTGCDRIHGIRNAGVPVLLPGAVLGLLGWVEDQLWCGVVADAAKFKTIYVIISKVLVLRFKRLGLILTIWTSVLKLMITDWLSYPKSIVANASKNRCMSGQLSSKINIIWLPDFEHPDSAISAFDQKLLQFSTTHNSWLICHGFFYFFLCLCQLQCCCLVCNVHENNSNVINIKNETYFY